MWHFRSLSQQQCGREAPREMQIAASPLLSCELWFKSQRGSWAALGLLENARANPYLQNPVVRSPEDCIVLNIDIEAES